ncbi:MAG TPA: fused MFS/spermidine synthase, partial [Chloroflexota bacterium]|nr:fused MFS/spermidine synthase [Chloroflexota bacterium]
MTWVRLLGLAFGVTIYAISTVLAAFMAGLAIGSLVGGRTADRVKQPLRMYGVVELGVGATALLTPWAFSWLQDVYAGLAQTPGVASAARTALAFAVLLVPTGLMGATLPLAVRGARRRQSSASGDARAMGVLYGLNTGGAILGCLLSGFVLIGRLGLSETIAAAALCNLTAGVGALLLARMLHPEAKPKDLVAYSQTPRSAQDEARPLAKAALMLHPEAKPKDLVAYSQTPRSAQDEARPLAKAALWVFGISGGISLAYEVVWSRSLAILFDSSIYGFVLMLATVLLGIAVGGALGGLVMGWRPAPRLAGYSLAALEISIGLAAVLALVAFGGAYDVLISLRDGPLGRLVRTDTRLMAALCVTTVLPAALLMGATFPVAARLWAAGSAGLGRRLGGIYGANVLLGLALLRTLRWRLWLMPSLALLLIGWGATRPPLHGVIF